MKKYDTTEIIRKPKDTDDDLPNADALVKDRTNQELSIQVVDLRHRVDELEKRLEWLRNTQHVPPALLPLLQIPPMMPYEGDRPYCFNNPDSHS